MAKDLDGSISGILTFSDDDKNNFYRYLQIIEQYLEPPEKKLKPSPPHQMLILLIK
jgi:hypothetical protein